MTMTSTLTTPAPHVAERIEPGAILYSSWGYDQTNVNYYMVTRTTEASCWIVPMSAREDSAPGFSPMAGHTTPLEPVIQRDRCACDHRSSSHYANHCDYADCECTEFAPLPVVPQRHKIRRFDYGNGPTEAIHLTSYSSAYVWDGRARYASHYA
jgi:hypothetical protein